MIPGFLNRFIIMSELHSNVSHSEQHVPGRLPVGVTLAVGFAGILLFVLIIWIAYVRNPKEGVDAALVAQRESDLKAIQAQGMEKITSYGVVDAQAGIYRIPVADAMELVVKQYATGPEPSNDS